MQGLGGCNINSISKRSNNESRTVSKIFITIVKCGIGNSDAEIFFSAIEYTLKLCLPVEIVHSANLQIVKIIEDISGVSIHGNQTHDFLSHWFVKLTLDHHNEAFQGIDLSLPALLDGVRIRSSLSEGSLAVDNPCTKVDKQGDLGWILLDPVLLWKL